MKDFTWEYQTGDEIGVIVEGTGVEATKHQDATSQTVFALLSPGCEGILEEGGTYEETINDKVIEIEVGNFGKLEFEEGLNKCVLENELHVKPGTSEYDSLNVEISSGSSTASQSSTASGLGQEMTISALANQTQGGSISNAKHVYYDWDMTCNGVDLLTHDEFQDNVQTNTEGMGISELTVIADFPDDCFTEGKGEVEVTTKVNEPRDGGGSNFGQTTQTFKIFNIENNPLQAHKTEIDGTLFDKTGIEICDSVEDIRTCKVMDNEVIALTATTDVGSDIEGMVSWKVNGKKYSCDQSISSACSTNGKDSGTIVIPMTGIAGKTFTVEATVNDVSQDTNDSYTMSRDFEIVDLGVGIVPVGDDVWYKKLPERKSLETESGLTQDESTTTLETAIGNTISLEANLTPSFLNNTTAESYLTYKWTIGEREYDTKIADNIAIPDDTDATVEITYTVPKSERRILRDTLGIGQTQTTKQVFTNTIQIKVVDSDITHNGIKGFFASTAHNAPEYLIFLLKMTLIVGLMLFVTSFTLGIGVRE